MKPPFYLLCVLLAVGFSSCKPDSTSSNVDTSSYQPSRVDPLEALAPVDNLLADLAGPSQSFTAPSDKPSEVKGEKGTIIHLDPAALETEDGSPLGREIKVELRELTQKSDLVMNRAATVSNGQLLESGGAYYIGMSSDGKPLRIKKGQGLEIEFPKLTDKEMALYFGERGDIDEMNWQPSGEKFVVKTAKKIGEAPKTGSPPATDGTIEEMFTENSGTTGSKDSSTTTGELADLEAFLRNSKPQSKTFKDKEEARKWRRENDKRMKEEQGRMRTFESMRVMRLGWINCDRIFDESAPRIVVPVTIGREALQRARVFAVISESNGYLYASYIGPDGSAAFSPDLGEVGLSLGFPGIPQGIKMKVVAIGYHNGTPEYFEEDVVAAPGQAVKVNLKKSSKEEIEKRLLALN